MTIEQIRLGQWQGYRPILLALDEIDHFEPAEALHAFNFALSQTDAVDLAAMGRARFRQAYERWRSGQQKLVRGEPFPQPLPNAGHMFVNLVAARHQDMV